MPASSSIFRAPLRAVLRLTAVLILAALAPPFVYAQTAPRRRDTYESRVEALALMQTLNADILSGTSATLSLEKWCRDHRLASEPKIVAHRVAAEQPPTAEQLQRLQVTDAGEIKYRRVELRCGERVLSEADNWYVPARLTPEMNRLLETSDTPFGKAVQPLRPFRRTFAVTLLWSPLPAGWESQPRPKQRGRRAGRLVLPKDLFEHRAVLYTSDNKPFSEVRERYQGQALDFPAAAPTATDSVRRKPAGGRKQR